MGKEWTRLELAELLASMADGGAPLKKQQELPKNFQGLFLKNKHEIGLTMSNIVWLGNRLESADYTEPALKNWVKREIKEYIGAPQVGRKYSIQQAALLFIVKDIKVLLDFEAIRKVLGSIFNNPVERADDIISPVVFYHAYACLYEKLMSQTEILTESHIKEEIHAYLHTDTSFSPEDKGKILNALMVAVLAVRANFLKTLAKRYVMDTNG